MRAVLKSATYKARNGFLAKIVHWGNLEQQSLIKETMIKLYHVVDTTSNGSMELRQDSVNPNYWVVFNTVTNRSHFDGTEIQAKAYWEGLKGL